MAAVPRHIFVEEALASRAYEDTACRSAEADHLPALHRGAHDRTAAAGPGHLGKTLEIGAGCGYQAAVLARLAKEVYAVERIAQLLDKARANLRQLRLPNVRLKHADGSLRVWRKPRLSIQSSLPPLPLACRRPCLAQLAVGGRMILPLGGDRAMHFA
jgi:protein-L-isoaspartate(D-aspartate) O-methyltransferase